ncbi:MAG: hypothetical protein AABX38_03445 [Candidatus Micrarchaeota archaeon]
MKTKIFFLFAILILSASLIYANEKAGEAGTEKTVEKVDVWEKVGLMLIGVVVSAILILLFVFLTKGKY